MRRKSPGRRRGRAARFGTRQPSRMSEYQRNRQAELAAAVADGRRLRAHLDGLDLDPDTFDPIDEDNLADTLPGGADDPVDDEPDEPYDVPKAVDPAREPTAYELAILGALQHQPVYQGTVQPDQKRGRRRRNRVARRSRQLNRR